MKKPLLITAGIFCLCLGIPGVFLPLLPGTPLLLMAAWCFVRSSDRLYNWLINNKIFGPYIKTYRDQKAISLRVKISSLTLLWSSILFSVFMVIPLMPVKILMILIAMTVSVIILRIKTLKK